MAKINDDINDKKKDDCPWCNNGSGSIAREDGEQDCPMCKGTGEDEWA